IFPRHLPGPWRALFEKRGVEREQLHEPLPPARRDVQPARFTRALEPAVRLIGGEQRGAERSRDVRPALGPVDAAARERAALRLERRDVDAQLGIDAGAKARQAPGDGNAEL